MNIPGLYPYDAHDFIWGMDAKYREGYVRSKFQLASMYQPKRICEIGVYSGIAAMCFLATSPKAMYMGIDNKSAEFSQGISVVDAAWDKMLALGYDVAILEGDSQKMNILPNPPYDFIHVDGDHTPEGAYHDTILAWAALTPNGVLLIDDCHNMQVMRGVTAALHDAGTDLLNWSYYDEGVGTMVVHREPRIR